MQVNFIKYIKKGSDYYCKQIRNLLNVFAGGCSDGTWGFLNLHVFVYISASMRIRVLEMMVECWVR